MNSAAEKIKKIIERFKLEEPVKEDDQHFARRRKRGLLLAILKSIGEYGLFYGLALRVFFAAKNIGVGLSMAQSVAVTLATAAVVAASATGGVVYYIKYHYPVKEVMQPEQKSALEPLAEVKKNETSSVQLKQGNGHHPQYRLGIQPFSGENVDEASAVRATDLIIKKLKELKGEGYLTSLSNRSRTGNVAVILVGSVGKIGDNYVIFAKLIDVATGNNIFSTSETVTVQGDFDSACGRVAGQLSDNL